VKATFGHTPPSEESPVKETPTAASESDLTVLALARELARAEARCAALSHQRRWPIAGLALAAALGFGTGAYVAAPVGAQTQGVLAPAARPPLAAPGPTRDQLMAQLPPADRARLEEFEQKVGWLSQYMRSSPQFDAGAAVALFLSSMAKSIDAMPGMYAEMQAMNAKMNAMPVLANEVAGMNAKMTVITANMDSTMGRAGRMMPWGW
jgi:hypothetical protein